MPSTTMSDRSVPQVQYATPTVGQTVTVNSNGNVFLLINPAGTLASLTITLPGSPSDGDSVLIKSTQIVTTLTMNGGTIINALVALAVGTTQQYVYSATAAKWL